MKLPYIILQQNNNSPETFTFSVKVENGIGITRRKWLKGNVDLFKKYNIGVDFDELGFSGESAPKNPAEENGGLLRESAYKVKKWMRDKKKEMKTQINIIKSKK